VRLQTIGIDMVPLQEEHEARLERNIRLADWGAMDVMEKALIIASRRIQTAIRNLNTEAEIKQAERTARRK
jgi:predicted GTPase